MRYHYPEYYRKFECTGGACQDTCCKGWRIGIDQKSYRTYRRVPGEFGRRLHKGIDHKSRVFHLEGRVCTFLNKDGLCDIYQNLGEEMLCRTCKTYPRHREDFGDLQEMLLSLSCPEAARLILQDQQRGAFLKKETSKPAEAWGDQELLESLLQVRQTMIDFLMNKSMDFSLRLSMMLGFAHDVQRRLNDRQENLEKDLECLSRRYQAGDAPDRFAARIQPYREKAGARMLLMNLSLREMALLEPVMEDWKEETECLCRRLFHQQNQEQYLENHEIFLKQVASLETEWENLVLYFINTYVLGAIYDNDVISKVKMAVFSYLFLREQCFDIFLNHHTVTGEQLLKVSCHYSREVENSWRNQRKIEQMMRQPLFSLEHLLQMI